MLEGDCFTSYDRDSDAKDDDPESESNPAKVLNPFKVLRLVCIGGARHMVGDGTG